MSWGGSKSEEEEENVHEPTAKRAIFEDYLKHILSLSAAPLARLQSTHYYGICLALLLGLI